MSLSRLAAAASLVVASTVLLAGHATACDDAEDLAQRRADVVARLKGADKGTIAKERYALGQWAKKVGLDAEARKEFELAIEADPDHAAARDALGFVKAGDRWLTHSAAMKEKGLVLRDGVWLLQEEADILDLPEKEKARRREAHTKVNELLKTFQSGSERARKFAVDALGTVDDEYKLEPMAYALRWKSRDVRELAAKELGRLKNRRALRPLLHRAIMDPVEEVRFAAIDAAALIGDKNLLAPLVGALGSENQQVRMNAASAISRTGDVRGIKYLVYKYEARGGGSPRVFYSSVNQLTFIQDFDVEVAQTAFIADPIVGVIQEGLVLDAQVVATSEESYFVERQVIHGALTRLTGASEVPNEKGAWAKWYKANKDRLVASND